MASPFRSLAPTTPRTEDIPGLDYRVAPLPKGMQFQHLRNWSLRATTPITPRIIGTPELEYRAVPLDFPIYLYNPTPLIKVTQAITFNDPGDQVWNVPLNLVATASSGLPVTFMVISGPAVLAGTTLTFSGVGPVMVTAYQIGDAHWAAATPVTHTFQVNPIDQTITFADPGDQIWTVPLTLVGTATSGLTVTFTVDAGPATIVGGQAVFSTNGSVTITAHQAGNAQYNAAPDVSRTFSVLPVPAEFSYPNGLTVDSGGNIFVADTNNHTIRKITPAGVITTFAGTAGAPGSADGTGAAASFYLPSGICVDGADNLYVADTYNHTIRQITPAAVVTTLAGLAGANGHADGTGSVARFHSPYGITSDAGGTLYVADSLNCTIRKITTGGVVTTFAGLALTAGHTDGTGAAARFNAPWGLCIDNASGNVYVADGYNFVIRQITSAAVVTTLAGTALAHGSTDGTGAAARFYQPYGISVDASGTLYVVDSPSTIRKIAAGAVVTTLAGTYGMQGTTDGTGAAARFHFGPTAGGGMAGCYNDATGNIFVADSNNDTIRKITPLGVVTTHAGVPGSGGSTDYP